MASAFPTRVTLVEVGPRDGLQNEAAPVPLDIKVAFVEVLADAGLPMVEAGAFVHPQAVPQMADSDAVFGRVQRREGTRYVALVPNLRGYDRALAAGARDVAVFTAASETFSRRNTRCTIDESLGRIREVTQAARRDCIPVRAYLSTVWWCPYEGRLSQDVPIRLAQTLLDGGAWQVSLGDTIGRATPGEVGTLLDDLLRKAPAAAVALHCHDTFGTGLANVLVGLQHGISTIDTSAGGLGGCPYAPGAAGNLATEDALHMLHGMGVTTGVDLERVVAASAVLEPHVRHALPGRTYRALRSGSVQPAAAP